MKKYLLTALSLTAASILLPILVGAARPIEYTAPRADRPSGSLYYIADTLSVADAASTLRFKNGSGTAEISMDEYLLGALAAEMPASFEPEALKAQAVALRTYALYKVKNGTPAHPEADICSDSACCAAWADAETLRERWGADYDTYTAKLRAAIAATDGVYLTYGDEPALAVFHASSAGMTEASGDVWSTALPYLVSVESPENDENVPHFVSEITLTAEEFRSAISEAYPAAVFPEDTAQWLTGAEYSAGGRLVSLTIGGVTVPGTALRALFSLRSTAMTIAVAPDSVTITTRGSGHGVGMSQYGANLLALDGLTCEEILAHYYPGTALAFSGTAG